MSVEVNFHSVPTPLKNVVVTDTDGDSIVIEKAITHVSESTAFAYIDVDGADSGIWLTRKDVRDLSDALQDVLNRGWA